MEGRRAHGGEGREEHGGGREERVEERGGSEERGRREECGRMEEVVGAAAEGVRERLRE